MRVDTLFCARQVIIARSESAQLPRLLAGVGVAATMAAWAYYMNGGLVLSHYDAKAHLVVARRVFDSITPGWRQVGAVWLPLPHLINLLPTQIDFLYRTGVFASMVSIACIGVTIWAAAKLNLAITGSALAAVTSAALLLLNPNLLYLHVTPMTEPLLLAIVFLSTLWMFEWTLEDSDMVPRKLGCALFAAAWTRYEAWPIMAVGLIAAAYARWRAGVAPQKAMLQALRLAAWPGIALLLFALNSRLTVGSWFVTEGFLRPGSVLSRSRTAYAGRPVVGSA